MASAADSLGLRFARRLDSEGTAVTRRCHRWRHWLRRPALEAAAAAVAAARVASEVAAELAAQAGMAAQEAASWCLEHGRLTPRPNLLDSGSDLQRG